MSSTVRPARCERLAGGRGHAPHGVAVDVGALHAQHALVALGVEQVGLCAVGAEHEAADAELELAARDDHGAGAVAEEHGRRAIVMVDDAAERLGAAHEHDRRAAGLDERGGLVEAVEEAGAGRVEVDRRGALGADDARDLGRQARRHAVGREGRDDDVVDLGAGAPGVVEGQQAGARRQVGQRLVALEVTALADAGAAHDPLVVRRSRMPVRRTIHSSLVSRRCSRSALVMTCSGSAAPMPKMPAVMPRRRVGVRRRAMAGVGVCSAVAAMLTRPPAGFA